jgi:hypothetical protein
MRIGRSWWAGAVVGAVIFAANPGMAHADPDPHIPDPIHDYSPGSGISSKLAWGVCDGARYPDGTYWHVQGFINTLVNVMCAAGTPGDVGPPPAPPGGCEGKPPPDIPTHR